MTALAADRAASPGRPLLRRLDASRWSGVVFVALAVPAAALSWATTPYTDGPRDYVDAYADGSSAGFGRFLALVALIAFLWALARLRAAFALDRAGVAAAAIGPSGTLFAAAWLGMFATMTAVGSAVEMAGGFENAGFEVVPETAVVLDFVTDGFTWALMIAAAVLVWAIALAGRRTGTLPGWLVWVGIVLVPLLPFGWLFFMVPVVVFLAWLAVVVALVPARSGDGGAS